MWNRGKPDPAIYALACKRLKINPSSALALEDSYNGIISAGRAGMKVIMIPDLLEDETPVKEVFIRKIEDIGRSKTLDRKELFDIII